MHIVICEKNDIITKSLFNETNSVVHQGRHNIRTFFWHFSYIHYTHVQIEGGASIRLIALYGPLENAQFHVLNLLLSARW